MCNKTSPCSRQVLHQYTSQLLLLLSIQPDTATALSNHQRKHSHHHKRDDKTNTHTAQHKPNRYHPQSPSSNMPSVTIHCTACTTSYTLHLPAGCTSATYRLIHLSTQRCAGAGSSGNGNGNSNGNRNSDGGAERAGKSGAGATQIPSWKRLTGDVRRAVNDLIIRLRWQQVGEDPDGALRRLGMVLLAVRRL